jgi:hypothetical protein
MCTQYMTIFTLLYCFPTSSPFHSSNPPRQDLFHSLFLWFYKRKKKLTFLFV